MKEYATSAALLAAAAEDVDWLAHWRTMVDAEHAQSERAMRTQPPPAHDQWAPRAGRFAAAMQRVVQPDPLMRALLPHLRPADTVLDIGAGSGRHALYLATQVARVVALEPSAAMRAQLEQRLASQPQPNVSVVAQVWPAPAGITGDVAIAAHVVYAVREIGPFLLAMRAAARRGCFLAASVRPPSFMAAPFWERVYGEARLPLPGALECLGALHQLGIPAQAALLPATPYSFADADEALADLRARLYLPLASPHDAALRAALDELLERDAEGRLVPRTPAPPVAAIWWQAAPA